MKTSRVVVVGLGYVGCVTAACLARLGYEVTGVDRDVYKVDCVSAGRSPFFEPELDPLLQSGVRAGLLTASTSLAASMTEADIVMICVGTPSERNGNISLEQVRRVVAELAKHVGNRTKPLTVAIRCTVFPGTCEKLLVPILNSVSGVSLVANPEFLREGSAVHDFFEPSLVVIGGHDTVAVEGVARLYGPLECEVSRVSLRAAEVIKYACNSFHALKIAFANEIGVLCARLGISGSEVMEVLCRDGKLNASAAYLKPGFAFGGSCLPKDLRALVYRASRLDLSLPLMESILPSNSEHLRRAIRRSVGLPGSRIGIFGLAFKENTDDLRESPVVGLIEHLIGKGREVKVFDPQIRLDEIYGSNRDFLVSSVPHIEKLLVEDRDSLVQWAEHLIVTKNLTAEDRAWVRSSGLRVLDLVNTLYDGTSDMSDPDVASTRRFTSEADHILTVGNFSNA